MIVAAIYKRPKRGATAKLGLITLGLVIVGVPLGAVSALLAHQRGLRHDWDIKGLPCPPPRHSWREIVMSREPHSFKYGGADFAHPFGAADCASVPDGPFITGRAYYACQFTAPIIISVTAGGQTQFFEPGPGRHATVSLRRGRIACVLGGWNEA
ncbi:MAG: hypothetical protein ACXU8S_02795 [Phenylobacterium sp.]